jgi:hypothetical protein
MSDSPPVSLPPALGLRFVRGSKAFGTLSEEEGPKEASDERLSLEAARAYREALENGSTSIGNEVASSAGGRVEEAEAKGKERRKREEKELIREEKQRRRKTTSHNSLFRSAESDELKALSVIDPNTLYSIRDAHGWSLLSAAAAVGGHQVVAFLLAVYLHRSSHSLTREGERESRRLLELGEEITAAAQVARRAEAEEMAAALLVAGTTVVGNANSLMMTAQSTATSTDQGRSFSHAAEGCKGADSGATLEEDGKHGQCNESIAALRESMMDAVSGCISAASAAQWRCGVHHAMETGLVPGARAQMLAKRRAADRERRDQAEGDAPWMCDVCGMQVKGTRPAHQASVGHRLRVAEAAGPTPPVAGRGVVLTAKNRGYRLLRQAGWDEKSGLGPKGEGRMQPVRTQLKRDRKGLGAVEGDAARHAHSVSGARDLWRALDAPPPKLVAASRSVKRPALDGRARVSHFAAYDTRAVQAPRRTHQEAAQAGQPISLRAQLAAVEKDKVKERKLRELFRDDFS